MAKVPINASYNDIRKTLHKHERGAFKMYCKSQERTIVQQLRYYIRNFKRIHKILEDDK